VLALVATGLFAGLGIARRRLGDSSPRPRRLRLAIAVGLALTLVTGATFTTAAIVNEVALSNRPAIASRFGPTDPDLEPPTCDSALTISSTARLELRMDASIDGRYAGRVAIDGIRDGADVRWSGFAATRFTLGQHGLTRIAGRVWELRPGTRWTSADAREGDGGDLDRQLALVALPASGRSVASDRGLDFIEGARARHCRITVDGTILRSALPEIGLLVGDTDVSRWRGDLDFWVFADGQVGQVDGRLNGPATGIDNDALLAGIRFRLLSFDRGLPINVLPPAG